MCQGLYVRNRVSILALGEHVVQEDGPPVCDRVAPVAAVGPAFQLPSAQCPVVGAGSLPAHLKYRQHLQGPRTAHQSPLK